MTGETKLLNAIGKVKRKWRIIDGQIRCTFKGQITCPVCAAAGVAGTETGNLEPVLGVCRGVITEVADAADHPLDDYPERPDLRRRLLRFCKLKERR